MRAAFYECDITPPLGGYVWGRYREVRPIDVQDKLYAKALVVEDGGEVAAIVVVDCCALPEGMHEAVTRRITEYTGIPAERVCLTCNHTHLGAPICDSPEIDCYADAAYRDVCFRLCADAVILAYKRLDETEIAFGTSTAHGYSFCRNCELLDGTYKSFPASYFGKVKRILDEPDEELPVLLFSRAGRPVGAVITFALHQCTVKDLTGYSGDYASILSARLKERYGQDFVSLFLIGTCGDVNHNPHDPKYTKAGHVEIGEALADFYEASAAAAKPIGKGGVGAIKEGVAVGCRPSGQTPENLAKLARLSEKPNLRFYNLAYYMAHERPSEKTLLVQCIRIGDVLIACLPGEMYTAFGRRIKENSPFAHTIVVENCNNAGGYIPTKEVFDPERDDLYETSLCCYSCLVPEAGDIVTDYALTIAERLATK